MGKRVSQMTPEEHAQVKADKRRRHAANPQPARDAARAWRAANKERAEANIAAWRAEHPERIQEYARRKKLKSYGLTMEEYQALYEAQGGLCAICGEPELEKWVSLSVDHDHVTQGVRGLLCHRCNRTLGMLNDDPLLFAVAAAYLAAYE